MKETDRLLMVRSAALRTMNLVSPTTSTSMATEPPNLQDVRSGVRRMSYRFGTANFGRRGCPLNSSISISLSLSFFSTFYNNFSELRSASKSDELLALADAYIEFF